MSERLYNVLFLCTGNSARSVLAEGLLNAQGAERFRAFSAGSHPAGQVNPFALALLERNRIATANMRSKSWDEFAQPGAPAMDMIITVCDSSAGEVCPVWPGHPMTAHWGVEDPAAVQGSDEDKRAAFLRAYTVLQRRVGLLVDLPLDKLDRIAATQQLKDIGKQT